MVSMLSDDHLKLDAQICIQGKKKSVGKRITGFQVVIDKFISSHFTCVFNHCILIQYNSSVFSKQPKKSYGHLCRFSNTCHFWD